MVKKIKLFSIKSDLQGRKALPIATSFTLFLVAISIVLGIGAYLTIFFPVDALVRESRKDFISQGMEGVGREITSFIEQRNLVLKDYASFPVVTQAVMQPQANLGNIQDFLDELSLLGSKVPLTLLDFSGQKIYSTNENSRSYDYLYQSPPKADETLILDLVFNESRQSYDWQIIQPIVYQGYAEGFLVANIPMALMAKAISLKSYSENHRIQIKDQEKTYFDMGDRSHQVDEFIPLTQLGFTLAYHADESSLIQGRDQLMLALIGSLLLFLVISVMVANFFGHRYLIQPLEKLRLFANHLAEGKQVTLEEGRHKFKEISELESYFKVMVDKLLSREHSLQEAKTSLESLNAQLVSQQQQLVHSEKLASVGHLAAGVAHEINNPAAYVKGNLEVLQDYKSSIQQVFSAYTLLEHEIENEHQADLTDTVNRIQALKQEHDIAFLLTDIDDLLKDSLHGMVRIQKIVMDLKRFSRVDDSDKTSVDLNKEVIEIAVRMVSNELKFKANVHLDLAPLPKLDCFPGELSQVMMNLLINARDAMREVGDISISSEYVDEQIIVKVRDTGEGIPEENFLTLFDPFFTTKEVGKGTGLGLSISMDIMKKHGGDIQVESQLGKGTCFTLLLPLTGADESHVSDV